MQIVHVNKHGQNNRGYPYSIVSVLFDDVAWTRGVNNEQKYAINAFFDSLKLTKD